MTEWKEVRLGDVCSILGDGIHGTPVYSKKGEYYFINGNNLCEGHIVFKQDTKRVSEEEYQKHKKNLNNRTLLFSINGTVGNVAKYNGEPCILGKSACYFNVVDTVDKDYIYYVVSSPTFVKSMSNLANGTTIKNVSLKQMREKTFLLPPTETQYKISSILSTLDSKIECNRKICANLEAQAQALFKHWFIDFAPFKDGKFVESELGLIPEGWRVGKADDFYTINIGKTPPRAERQWFSESKGNNKIWISISDMGGCGAFISDSKEYLTPEAQSKFNVVMVPAGTILLSFKLTIGRVAIADNELTTNEAIARFILPNSNYREFTYLYLRQYNYGSLGSTSSIATAVNSKIIKSMPFLMPSAEVMTKFSSVVSKLFDEIRIFNNESRRLSTLRDTLLPKLMSGEIKI